MKDAHYRKYNDRSQNSSTYHKKDGTSVRSKLKEDVRKEVGSIDEQMTYNDLVDGMTFEFTDEPGVKFKKIDGCEYQNVLTGVSMSLNYGSEFTVMNWEK